MFARRLGKRGKRRRVGLIGVDRSLADQGEGEGAEAGKQIGEVLGALRPIPDQFGESGFSLARGLEEGTGRQPHFGAGQIDLGRGDRPDALALDRQPRHAQGGGFAGKGAKRRGARPDAFEHDIEAALGLGQAHPRLALAAQKGAERLFQLGQARDDARRQDRADIDVDQFVRAGAAIAESEPLFAAAKRKRGAPAAADWHRPHGVHLGVEPARTQGGHDQLALPGQIGARLEMLQRAAAAHAEMRADRRDAVGARLQHFDQAGAVAAGRRPRL